MAIEKANIRDSYKYYKTNAVYPVVKDIATYMHIATGFMKFLAQKILDGYQVQLGNAHSLGVLAVVGKKIKIRRDKDGNIRGMAVNWPETKKLWASNPQSKIDKVFVFYTNEHSGGIKYNLVWWKTDMKIGNKNLYSFTFCKPMRRRLSAKIREGKEYLVYI